MQKHQHNEVRQFENQVNSAQEILDRESNKDRIIRELREKN